MWNRRAIHKPAAQDIAQQSFWEGWNQCYDALARAGVEIPTPKPVVEPVPAPKRAKFRPGVAAITEWEATEEGQARLAKEAKQRAERLARNQEHAEKRKQPKLKGAA